MGGAKDITAVEVNADLVDLMNKHSNYNGGLYNGFPGVKVVVGEGRHFIRADKQKYDIIMLSIPVTKTSRSPEGYVLTENFLFTVESINDYLDHLKAHGRLIVVAHHEMEIYRLVLTSLSALNKRGIQQMQAMKHIYTIGNKMFPVFVLKKTPLTMQEAERVHEQMHERGLTTLSSFIPFIEQEVHLISLGEGIYQQHPMLNQVLYMMSKGEVSAEDLIKMTDFNLKAVSDNDPFFYKFNIGLPALLSFLLIFSTIAMIGGWVIKPGYMKEDISRKSSICLLLFFSALGIGFMMIEIPLIQKFTLFLGQPVYSLTILLFSVLIGAGMGSWFSGQMGRIRTLLKLRLAVMMVSAITIIYVIFLNPFFQLLLGSPFYIRALASFILLMPLGFFLGMPFPLGMKLLAELDLEHLVPRMWGVNGIGSVLGSALSIALAISFGFSYALILGIALYSLIYILFSKQILALPPEVRG